jgi:putative glycosyltransferase (TIGR04372 family)
MSFLRKIARLCFRAVAYLLLVPMDWLVEHFFHVRITPLHVMRIGGLAPMLHFFVADRKLHGPESKTARIFYGAVPCNSFLFEMWQRILPVIHSRLMWVFYQYTSDILDKIPTFRPLPTHLGANRVPNCNYLVDRAGPVLEFSDDDHLKGQELLASMGLGRGDWFVCFQARDSIYQNSLEAHGDDKSHRNAPIETYIKAAHYITELGGFAIRMGYLVEAPIPETGNPRIIDYASNFRSDFGDIYLLGNCRFFLCSSSGAQAVPPLFNVPVATAHMISLWPQQVGTKSTYIPKFMKRRETGEILSFKEFFDATVRAEDYLGVDVDLHSLYENDTYTIVDNNEDDVLDLCLDMFDLIEDRKPPDGAEFYQNMYMDRFVKPAEDLYKFGPRISPRFALKYGKLIEMG